MFYHTDFSLRHRCGSAPHECVGRCACGRLWLRQCLRVWAGQSALACPRARRSVCPAVGVCGCACVRVRVFARVLTSVPIDRSAEHIYRPAASAAFRRWPSSLFRTESGHGYSVCAHSSTHVPSSRSETRGNFGTVDRYAARPAGRRAAPVAAGCRCLRAPRSLCGTPTDRSSTSATSTAR